MRRRLDLNVDAGEGTSEAGVGDDAAVLPLVTSVNIACGGHGGDAQVMHATLRAAAALGVAAGAHPGYPDRAGFGRRPLPLSPEEIEATVRAQLATFADIAATAGVPVHHVKPHGALYHRAATDRAAARALARAVQALAPGAWVYGLAGSVLLEEARAAGLPAAAEGFADRRYTTAGLLVPRGEPGATLDDPAAAAEQASALARAGTVETICLHGDHPGAAARLAAVRARLLADGVTLAAP